MINQRTIQPIPDQRRYYRKNHKAAGGDGTYTDLNGYHHRSGHGRAG